MLRKPFRVVFNYIEGFSAVGGYDFLSHCRPDTLDNSASEITAYFFGCSRKGTFTGYRLELSAVFGIGDVAASELDFSAIIPTARVCRCGVLIVKIIGIR